MIRVAALATLHGKERVFAAGLRPLGIEVRVAPVDTDAFGTFTRRVPRVGTAREVMVKSTASRPSRSQASRSST